MMALLELKALAVSNNQKIPLKIERSFLIVATENNINKY